MGITQRTLQVVLDHSKERFSPRKLVPVNPKTLGGQILLKRIEADLSQPEMAVKAGVSVRKVQAWEHDKIIPTGIEWRVLAGVLHLDSSLQKS